MEVVNGVPQENYDRGTTYWAHGCATSLAQVAARVHLRFQEPNWLVDPFRVRAFSTSQRSPDVNRIVDKFCIITANPERVEYE